MIKDCFIGIQALLAMSFLSGVTASALDDKIDDLVSKIVAGVAKKNKPCFN